jgi:hypothetical protein
VSEPESFARVAERVCHEQGWELLPGGVRVSLPDGRSQLVDLERYDAGSGEVLRLWTGIGPVDRLGEMRMEVALRANADLERGALAIRDDTLGMIETFTLDEITADEFERAIGFLAQTADRYEKSIYATDEN